MKFINKKLRFSAIILQLSLISIFSMYLSLKESSSTTILRKTERTKTENKALAKIVGRDKNRFKYSSQLQDGDRGSIYSLTKHNIQCEPGAAISGFHMYGKTGVLSNDNAYEWNCSKSNLIHQKIYNGITGNIKIKDHRDSSNSLQFLGIFCPPLHVLNRFQLKKHGENYIYYEYSCVEASMYNGFCKDVTTDWKDANWGILGLGNKSVTELADLYLEGPKKWGLVGFSLIYRKDKKQIGYQYKTCEFKQPPKENWNPPALPPFPKENDFQNGGNDINSFNIDCGKDKIIDSFKVVRGQLKYKCRKVQSNGMLIPMETALMDTTIIACSIGQALSGFSLSNQGPTGLSMTYLCLGVDGLGFGMNEYPGKAVQGDITALLNHSWVNIPFSQGITMMRIEPDLMTSTPGQFNSHKLTIVTGQIGGGMNGMGPMNDSMGEMNGMLGKNGLLGESNGLADMKGDTIPMFFKK